jgi:PPOX class probable F420-dependent enzyme
MGGADLTVVRRLVAADHGLAVVSVARPDGRVQSSVVNAGVLDHPISGEPVVGLVARGDARKVQLIRDNGRASVVLRSGWEWVAVEGPAEIIGPDDPVDGVDVPALLRAVFAGAGGTHDDWDTFDRVMADERRAAVLIEPARVTTN